MTNKIKKWFRKNQKGAVFGGILGGVMSVAALANAGGPIGKAVYGILDPACRVVPSICSANIILVAVAISIGAIIGSIIDNYR